MDGDHHTAIIDIAYAVKTVMQLQLHLQILKVDLVDLVNCY